MKPFYKKKAKNRICVPILCLLFLFKQLSLFLLLDRVARLALAVYFPHATRHSEGCCDGGEDGDNHVDDHLPGFFLAFL